MNLRLGPWLAALGLWLAGSAIPHAAQQAADLRVEKRADVDQIAPGGRVRLVLTLANEGTADLTGLVVTETVPEGTGFFGASGPRDWMITTPRQDEQGSVTWRSTAPLAPGDSAELVIVVTVRAEGGTRVVSRGCTIDASGWGEPLTGPAVTVTVVAPTATPVPGWTERVLGEPVLWQSVGGLLALAVVAVALAIGLRGRASERKGPEV